MPKIFVTDSNGTEMSLEFTPGLTLMQTIYEAGCEGLLALCGGVCSCGTCHVYVDENSPVKFSDLPPMSEDEDVLLDGTNYRDTRSRLSCQICLAPEHDQLRVLIAPGD